MPLNSILKNAWAEKKNITTLKGLEQDKKLPVVLSKHEIQSLFQATHNLKHLTALAVIYSCGLRVSEIIHLKIKDIDSQRMVINIRKAKGNKDLSLIHI